MSLGLFQLFLVFTTPLINFSNGIEDSGIFKIAPKDVVPIIITANPPKDIHRSIVSPIEALYSDGYIYVSFNNIQGGVWTTVRNLNTGEEVNAILDSSTNTATIDISAILSPGDYIIEFICFNSETYIGQFYL